MYFDSFAAFLDMGGHGFYVWTCYALTLLLLMLNVLLPLFKKKHILNEQRRRLRREHSQKAQLQKAQLQKQQMQAEPVPTEPAEGEQL